MLRILNGVAKQDGLLVSTNFALYTLLCMD